jgi:hypothetical protein
MVAAVQGLQPTIAPAAANAALDVEPPLAAKVLLEPLKATAKWIWDVVVIRMKDNGFGIAALVAGASGLFPLWASVALIIAGIILVALPVRDLRLKLAQAEEDKGILQQGKRALEARAIDLTEQKGQLQLVHDDNVRKNRDLTRQRDRAIHERDELFANRADLLIERDRLRDQKNLLENQKDDALDQIDGLTEKLDAALKTHKELGIKCAKALEELGECKAQLGRAADYQKLNEYFEAFKKLYDQESQIKDKAIQFALANSIPAWKTHKEQWHIRLRQAMEDLEPDATARVALSGLHRISQDELEHYTSFIAVVAKALKTKPLLQV